MQTASSIYNDGLSASVATALHTRLLDMDFMAVLTARPKEKAAFFAYNSAKLNVPTEAAVAQAYEMEDKVSVLLGPTPTPYDAIPIRFALSSHFSVWPRLRALVGPHLRIALDKAEGSLHEKVTEVRATLSIYVRTPAPAPAPAPSLQVVGLESALSVTCCDRPGPCVHRCSVCQKDLTLEDHEGICLGCADHWTPKEQATAAAGGVAKTDYNHPNWPSPRAKNFANHLLKSQWSRRRVRSHAEGLAYLADHAGLTVEALLAMSSAEYVSKHMSRFSHPYK